MSTPDSPPRRRGQPAKLTPARRQALLDAITGGATLAAAAASVGVTRATVHNTRARDDAFDRAVAAALDAARRQRRRRPAAGPACPACTEPALALTADGVSCSACHTRFRLLPVPVRPATPFTLTPPPLAHAS